MKTYIVRIEEILAIEVPIKANSEDEALDLVKQQYFNEEIVLDESNFEDRSFKIITKPLAKKLYKSYTIFPTVNGVWVVEENKGWPAQNERQQYWSKKAAQEEADRRNYK